MYAHKDTYNLYIGIFHRINPFHRRVPEHFAENHNRNELPFLDIALDHEFYVRTSIQRAYPPSTCRDLITRLNFFPS